MTTIAATFQHSTKKLQMSTAAIAVAAAAVVTPVVAQAAPALPQAPSLTSFSQALGAGAGSNVCGGQVVGADCVLPVASSAAASANAGPLQNPLFQNPLWWFGSANPDWAAKQFAIAVFTPVKIPFIGPLLFGWLGGLPELEACVAGLSVKAGPYGTLSAGIGVGC
jgi:hypothetical protein